MHSSEAASSTTFEVSLPQPSGSKLERERRAFARLLPRLLTTHPGQYVAIHHEQVVDSGPDRLNVALRVLRSVGNVDIYVGLVGDQPPPLARFGVRRDLSRPIMCPGTGR